MNRLPVLLLLLFGLSACGSTQTKPQFPNESSNSNIPPVEPTPLASTSIDTSTNNQSNKDSIVGKWRLTETRKRKTKDGPLEIDTIPDSMEMNIEYFKNNTFLHTQKMVNIDNIEKPSDAIKNGEWRVLSDETIEKTYDSCQARTESIEKCDKQTDVNKIIFPDSDTLLDFGRTNRTDVGAYSEYVEKFYVYKRIN